MSGALALIAGLFIAGCTHDDVYDNVNVIEKKMQGFQQAFKEAFGPINPNQTWGFNQTDAEVVTASTSQDWNVKTRGNQDAPYNNSDNVQCKPSDITNDEVAAVVAYFKSHQGTSDAVSVNFTNFYVQQVYYDDGPFVDGNGTKYTGRDCVGQINTANGGGDNVFGGNDDFNKCRYLYNSSSLSFWYQNPKCGTWSNRFKMVYISGYGYYVGFDVEGTGQNPNEKITPDDWYYDRIIKVVPADEKGYPIEPSAPGESEPVITTEITYECRIDYETLEAGKVFCEDLSQFRNKKDFDYNDAVFDATVQRRTYTIETFEETFADGISQNDKHRKGMETGSIILTNIELFAAGGTLPLTIAEQEVHELFGVGGTTMVNTRDNHTPTVSGANTVTRDESVRLINPDASTDDFVKQAFKNLYPNDEAALTAALENWEDPRSAEEKAEDQYYFTKFGKILDIPVVVQYEDGSTLKLESKPGAAPHKILVDKTYPNSKTAVRWASERCSIVDAYPSFKDYVNFNKDVEEDKFLTFWLDKINTEYLYDQMNAISTEVKGDQATIAKGEGNVTLYVLWQSSDPKGYDISRGLYFTNTSLLNGIQVGDRFRIEGKTNGDWAIFLSDGNSSRLHSDATSLNNQNYAEVTLTKDMVEKLSAPNANAAMIISGYGVSLTRVSLIKK